MAAAIPSTITVLRRVGVRQWAGCKIQEVLKLIFFIPIKKKDSILLGKIWDLT